MAVAFVRSTGKFTGLDSVAGSFAALPAAGNFIGVMCWGWDSVDFDVIGVTDNQGNTYQQAGTDVTPIGGNRCHIYYAQNIGTPSGTFTVTIDVTSGGFTEAVCCEYSGVATSSAFDVTSNGTGTSTSPSTGSTAASAVADSLALAVMTATSSQGSIAVGGSFTQRAEALTGENAVGEADDQVLTATGAQSCSWTLDTNAVWSATISVFKGAAPSNTGAITIGAPAVAGSGKIVNPPSIVAAGAAAFTATSAATIAPGLPAGWAADDIHVLIAARSDNTAMTTLSGWTLLSAANNTAAQRVEVWWRRAVAGDTAPTITFGSGTIVRGARIIGIRGCPTTGDPFDVALSRSDNAASATTVTFASITPPDPLTLLLALYAFEDDPSAASQMSGWSVFTVSTSALGTDMTLGYASQAAPAEDTATGPLTTTVSGGTFASSVNTGLILALKSADVLYGTGDVSISPPVLDGTGTFSAGAITGTGAVSIGVPSVDGVGAFSTTGTGALSVAGPVLAGTGTAFDGPVSGTGALTIGAPGVAGAGTFAVTGSGALAIGVPVLAGAGTFTTTGTGAVSIGIPALDGTGTAFDGPVTGTGDLSIGVPVLAGTGTFAVTGSGAVSVLPPALAAAGSFSTTGTGALSIGAPSLAGTGTFTELSGQGAISIGAPVLAGTGAFSTTGAGAVSVGSPVLAADGSFSTVGSGALSIAGPSLAGAGTVSDPGTGSGAVTIAGPSLAASGTFTPATVTGTGDTAIGPPSLAAAGTFTTSGSGALSVGAPQIAGTGDFATTGAGNATIGPPALAGTGTFTVFTITGTAALTISAPGLAGTGSFATTGTGAITIGPPVLSGYSVLATRAAAADVAYSSAAASDAAYSGSTAGDLVLVGAAAGDSEV